MLQHFNRPKLQGRAGAGPSSLSPGTRVPQTREEGPQSRLYFFKLGGLKETALGQGLPADQLGIALSPDDSKTTLEGSRTFSIEVDSFNSD